MRKNDGHKGEENKTDQWDKRERGRGKKRMKAQNIQ